MILNIQLLRALAALAVVLYHIAPYYLPPAGDGGWLLVFFRQFGYAGVDVFFVISGYVIWLTSRKDNAPGAGHFLFKRLARIYLGYWPYLLITAGIMGYFGIPLKPSTALIFSIVFGISVDDSIHFLAKYRQELYAKKFNVSEAISKSIRETGSSMIYTSIILFFGFIIFVLSEFGGTIALGKLTSITLFFAMVTNVVVLPALILQFDSGKRDKSKRALIADIPELAEGIDENGQEVKKENQNY
ncbi:MAG: acyltransferase family protein [Ekhidna sp.]|nr:acyltransferase family protein [Ekhidna sp.]